MAPWSMAAPVVSPILGFLVNKADKLLSEEYELRKGEKEAVRSLEKTLKLIQATVAGADGQEVSLQAQEWLNQLKELLYSAYDVLEEYETAVTRSREEASLRVTTLQRLGYKLKFWRKRFFNNGMIVREIEKVKKHYEDLGRDRSTLGIQLPESRITAMGPFVSIRKIFPASLKRETASALDSPSSVLGRDDDIAEVLCWLKNESRENNVRIGTVEIHVESAAGSELSILPITGMGGIGKTTLARLVYNVEQVKDKFPSRMWVHVSEDFAVKKVIRDMLDPEGTSDRMPTTLEGLQSRLIEHIGGNVFLLVLDDVWPKVAAREWEDLLVPLKQHGGKGSKVLVTSRIDNVVHGIRGIVSIRQPLHLESLPDNCVQKIFNLAAFGYANDDEIDEVINDAKEFQEIRDELIKDRLKGSPLAAKTLGQALGGELDVRHWEDILHSRVWNIEDQEQDRSDIMQTLVRNSDLQSWENIQPNYMKRDNNKRLIVRQFQRIDPEPHRLARQGMIPDIGELPKSLRTVTEELPTNLPGNSRLPGLEASSTNLYVPPSRRSSSLLSHVSNSHDEEENIPDAIITVDLDLIEHHGQGDLSPTSSFVTAYLSLASSSFSSPCSSSIPPSATLTPLDWRAIGGPDIEERPDSSWLARHYEEGILNQQQYKASWLRK